MSEQGLRRRLAELKKERSAIILAHNYCRAEVQDAADYTGDSLGLSRTAAETDAERIVFCGVHFMAETAAILCPDKEVYMPDPNAGCPMANMATVRELAELKKKHPDAAVVTYVNSSAAIKAMSDICCTSANAVEVVEQIPEEREVIFVPDRNLGAYVAKRLGRKLILWNGYCPTHERILPEHVKQSIQEHPGAVFVAHPECRPDVLELADWIGSTTGILKYCHQVEANEFLIGTESGVISRLASENPGKLFYPASPVNDCPNMKLTTLEKIVWCLEDLSGRVTVANETAAKAIAPIRKMLEVAGG